MTFIHTTHVGSLPRPRDLEVTYTPEFSDIVYELRGHIGALRKSGTDTAAAIPQ